MKVVKKKKKIPPKHHGGGRWQGLEGKWKGEEKIKEKKNEDNSLPKHLTWITQTRASTTRHSKTKLHQK